MPSNAFPQKCRPVSAAVATRRKAVRRLPPLLGPPSVEVRQESAVISVQPAEKIAMPKGR